MTKNLLDLNVPTKFSLNPNFALGVLGCNLLRNKKIPFSASIVVTSKCNKRCVYCGYDKKDMSSEMTTSQINTIVDDLRNHGLKRICFTGGEPLLREDVGEVIDHAKSKNIVTTLVTNGTLLGNNIDKIKNVDILIVSLDGNKKAHELTRGQWDWPEIADSLKLLKGKLVFTMTTISKYTALEDIDFILNQGIKNNNYCAFQLVMQTESSSPADTINSLLPLKQKLADIVDLLVQRKKQGYPVAGSFKYFSELKNFYTKGTKFSKDNGCWGGKGFCAVGANGELSQCCVLLKDGSALNIIEQGFKNAYKNLRANFKCPGCLAYSFMEMSYLLSLDINVLFETLSKYKKTW